MEDYGNNGIFGVDRKQTRAVDGKQEIYFEWPNQLNITTIIKLVQSSLCVGVIKRVDLSGSVVMIADVESTTVSDGTGELSCPSVSGISIN